MREEDWIGRRVRDLRLKRGMTQQQLAAQVGIEQPYLSQIENGHRAVTTRRLLSALAEALGVYTNALTAAPEATRPAAADHHVHDAVEDIRAALDGALDLGPLPASALRQLTDSLMSARMACDYPYLGRNLPETLGHAVATAESAPETPVTYQLVARATFTASMVVRPMGYLDLAIRLAEHALAAGHRAGDTPAIGAATFALSQCSMTAGSQAMRQRALNLAVRGIERMGRLGGTDAETLGWQAMLHLQAGLASATLGDQDRALGHVADARRITNNLDGPDVWRMEITEPNTYVWEADILNQGPTPERAIAAAREVQPGQLHTTQRYAHRDIHLARALYLTGEPTKAVARLHLAVRRAPGEVSGRGGVRELVGQILREERRLAGSDALREVAARVGVDPYHPHD